MHPFQDRLRRRAVVAVLAAVWVLLSGPAASIPALAAHSAVRLQGVGIASWQFGIPDGYWNLGQTITVLRRTPTTYWAEQFPFAGSSTVGYMGLQADGVHFNGARGDMAIFSMWNADGARGGECSTFSNEGSGYSCRLAISLRTNVPYRLRVWRLSSDAHGTWWGAWVFSGATGRDMQIGAIHMPPGDAYHLLGTPLNFLEYFGPQPDACQTIAQSTVSLGPPRANYHGYQSNVYDAIAQLVGLTPGRCPR